jgi:hypothetical protein
VRLGVWKIISARNHGGIVEFDEQFKIERTAKLITPLQAATVIAPKPSLAVRDQAPSVV